MNPSNYRYAKTHEWICVEGAIGTVGITQYAADHLGDITYVESPEPGGSFQKGDEVAAVESIKAASDVYSPVSGRIIESNAAVESSPQLVNEDPYGAGWFFRIELDLPDELEQLLDSEAYETLVCKEEK